MSEETPVVEQKMVSEKVTSEEGGSEEVIEKVVVEPEPETALKDEFLGRSYVVEKEMLENVDKLYLQLSGLGDDSNTVDIINWLNGRSGANYQIPDSDFQN